MNNIDAAAHEVMAFNAMGAWKQGDLIACYHENRLYSVRDSRYGILSLVKAQSPAEAIAKIVASRKEPTP